MKFDTRLGLQQINKKRTPNLTKKRYTPTPFRPGFCPYLVPLIRVALQLPCVVNFFFFASVNL